MMRAQHHHQHHRHLPRHRHYHSRYVGGEDDGIYIADPQSVEHTVCTFVVKPKKMGKALIVDARLQSPVSSTGSSPRSNPGRMPSLYDAPCPPTLAVPTRAPATHFKHTTLKQTKSLPVPPARGGRATRTRID